MPYYIVFNHKVSIGHQEVMIWISVLFDRPVETILTADCCFIVEEVRLHAIAEQCIEVELIFTAREVADPIQQFEAGTLWMMHT